jgi:pimeloyl-ACP methyl ester carboxylesterase
MAITTGCCRRRTRSTWPDVCPNNELVIYRDAGHGGIFQYHEQFVEKALEFLAK